MMYITQIKSKKKCKSCKIGSLIKNLQLIKPSKYIIFRFKQFKDIQYIPAPNPLFQLNLGTAKISKVDSWRTRRKRACGTN